METHYGPESMAQSAILVSAEAHAFNLFNSGTSQSKNPFSFLKIGLGLKNRLCPWLHIEHIFRSFFFFFNLLLDWNTREHSAAVCFHFSYLHFLCEMYFWGKKGKKNVQLTKNWQDKAKLYDETETWWAFQSHCGRREKGTTEFSQAR